MKVCRIHQTHNKGYKTQMKHLQRGLTGKPNEGKHHSCRHNIKT